MLQDLGGKSYLGILHLWNLDAPLNSQLTLPALERAQVLGVGSLLHLVQALVKRSLKAKVWLITQGAMPAQAWLPEVAQAPAWGMAQAIALEHPDLWGGAIDLSQEGIQEIDELLRELQADPEEDRVAFRKGQRFVLRLVRSPLPASQPQFLRGDSTYLITGGLGALGLKVTNWAIQQRVKYLVLTSRRSPSPQEREILNQMKQGGSRSLRCQGRCY
ncbi:MAG: KR domain-containing protein [Chloroflexaceae bacterium]|nr:KR domain-containing protein [Chloroflexaceae bacterium]